MAAMGMVHADLVSSLAIEHADFEDVPFNQWGGLGGAGRAFCGERDAVLEEPNARLAA